MIYEGNHKLGDFFTSRRERGTPGLPMLSVTMNNGVVMRESLDRKMETNLSDEEHLLVRKDDIVYNMMRMWQGASGLADRDGLLSPAYVVLAPKKGIDPLYASYLFKSSRLIYLLWAYSYGLTSDRLRLYFNDFKCIPVNIPSLPEQRKIGKILSTWDKAISINEQLLSSSQQQKKALMQQLLTFKLRYCENKEKWRQLELEKICSINKGVQINKITLTLTGKYPVINGGVTPSGYTDDYNCEAPTITISEGGNSCGFIAYMKQPFWCGGHCYTLKDIKVDINYLFQFLKFHEPKIMTLRVGSGLPNIQKGAIANFLIAIPSDSEQLRIARILTAADREIETLQQKLTCLKQEKKALMQQLLTGKCRVKVDEL
ncbi:restriction endonuclease subunit S [Methylomicrobium sp. RS1]|uniref:restriction endonuclease subunit S n=1 Tax=Candidatus Methylomicrobium oryzae TaxID=2802053 RepID=UPI001923E9FB|nr:restriction endonuclease subunit S [Methylomicrobium sp. RS1]MBL1265141.1 restriction endonuclease subunit S [Methylomicrobium sp. RS1]